MRLRPLADLGDGLREQLSTTLERSPHDYIRGVRLEGDRALWAGGLLATLPPEDDIRAIFEDPMLGPVLVACQRLPWDSDFFGLQVARLNAVVPLDAPRYQVEADLRPAVTAVAKMARERGIAYLFAAVDSRDAAVARALGESGFGVIESRAFYHRGLSDYEHPERFEVRLAEAGDIEPLCRAAVEMVNAYDRFHADPSIPRELADRLMSRWVEASIRDGFADFTVVPNVPKPKAFCTVKLHRGSWDSLGLKLSQPVFSAVSTEFRGWYRRIISEICYRLKDLGSEHAYMITQTTNGAVIWVWESLGFRFGKNELVFRKLLD